MPVQTSSSLARTIMRLGSILAVLFVAACGSSKAKVPQPTPTPTLPPCTIAAADLSLGSGGTTKYTPFSNYSGTLLTESPPGLTPLLQEAATAFDNGNNHQTKTVITSAGAGNSLKDVASGAVSIGFSDLFASQSGVGGLTDTQLAVQVYTMIVSLDLQNKVTDLSTQQIIDIFSGHDTNWNQVGGPNEAINVIAPPTNSGSAFTFTHYVLGNAPGMLSQPTSAVVANTADAVVNDVANVQGAIGYVPTSYVVNPTEASSVTPICINSYSATAKAVEAGTYSFWGIEHAYTKTGGNNGSVAQAFIAFLRSPAFQNSYLVRSGFLQLGLVPVSVLETHQASS